MCLACDNDCCTLDCDDSCDCDDCHNAFCWSSEFYADKYGDPVGADPRVRPEEHA